MGQNCCKQRDANIGDVRGIQKYEPPSPGQRSSSKNTYATFGNTGTMHTYATFGNTG